MASMQPIQNAARNQQSGQHEADGEKAQPAKPPAGSFGRGARPDRGLWPVGIALPNVEIAATAVSKVGTYRLTAVVIDGVGNFSYTWLFDDGTQGTGASVTHTWAPGNYLITLEVKDDYGHVANATVAIVVGANATGPVTGSSGYAPIVVYLLVAALVAAALVALVLATRGRRPAAAPADDGSNNLAPLEPVVYEEESPRGPSR